MPKRTDKAHLYQHAASLGVAVLVAITAACAAPTANAIDVDAGSYSAEPIVEDLEHPWGLDFLGGHDGEYAVVTERAGNLLLVNLADGSVAEITGEVPEVQAAGQGGLLDVAVHPEYAGSGDWIYLTYSGADDSGNESATHLGRGRLDEAGPTLQEFEVLYVAEPFDSETGHFGSRIVFDEDGYLYMTTGDRRDRYTAQDLGSNWGKILRFHDDGSIPADNPFVDDEDALNAIYTYGHRNPQGLAVHPETGELWQNEHGEQDGDEINLIDEPGGNYGWPVATYDREYVGGAEIGDLPHERDDIVNPIYWWDGTRYDDGQSGFPPSGMTFHGGDLFMGNLPNEYLGRFYLEGSTRDDGVEVTGESRIVGEYGRVRDVRSSDHSDYLYVLIDAAPAPLLRVRVE